MSVKDPSCRTSQNAALKGRQLVGIDLGATNVRVARMAEDRVEQIQTETIAEVDGPAAILKQIMRVIKSVGADEADSIDMGEGRGVDVERGIVAYEKKI